MGLKSMLKRSKLTYALANALRHAPDSLLTAYMKLCHALRGVDAKKVYFSSFSGRLYNENPRYVCEALHEICPEAKIVFRLNREGRAQPEVPDYVQKIPQFSPRALYHMATARVIVKNARFKTYMRKFPDQIYFQLWHGDRGLKKIIFDLEPGAVKKYIDWKYMDIGVSASEFGSRVYMRSAFGFKGELLECGYPKNDLLVKNPPEIAQKVRKALGIPEDVRCLLYAPTFRDKSIGGSIHANFSMKRLHETLERATGEKWLCLTRGHTLNTSVHSDEGIDVSAYPDASELMLVCDMLITDYSSIAGDYMLLKRPIILYHADRSSYTAVDRGLVFDPDASPYIVAHNEAELLDIVSKPIDGKRNCEELLKFYGSVDRGTASETVARRIRDFLKL